MVKLVVGDKVDVTPVLTVRLNTEQIDGGVTIQTIDQKGRVWNIATLLNSGILKLHRSLPDNIGLQLERGPGTIAVTRNEDCG